MLVYFLALRDQFGGWGGRGRIDEVWNLGTMFSQLAKRSTRMLVIGIFEELRAFVVVSDALRKESFLLQMKYAMSASVEIILFWAYLIILVRESEPKLKETTVNYFKLRHHRSIEEYTLDNSETVNQDARIAWASLMSSLEVARYDCLPHLFSLALQPPLFRVKIKKKSHFQLVFEPVIFF